MLKHMTTEAYWGMMKLNKNYFGFEVLITIKNKLFTSGTQCHVTRYNFRPCLGGTVCFHTSMSCPSTLKIGAVSFSEKSVKLNRQHGVIPQRITLPGD
jgi:hypothetical protein